MSNNINSMNRIRKLVPQSKRTTVLRIETKQEKVNKMLEYFISSDMSLSNMDAFFLKSDLLEIVGAWIEAERIKRFGETASDYTQFEELKTESV